mmetsp:Transcript_19776/g.67358  ORF Transcript_19776/g.67358 Transcript_19776/m.67358 type:complete len:213 (+) Transcript_19776:3710-4348(+)
MPWASLPCSPCTSTRKPPSSGPLLGSMLISSVSGSKWKSGECSARSLPAFTCTTTASLTGGDSQMNIDVDTISAGMTVIPKLHTLSEAVISKPVSFTTAPPLASPTLGTTLCVIVGDVYWKRAECSSICRELPKLTVTNPGSPAGVVHMTDTRETLSAGVSVPPNAQLTGPGSTRKAPCNVIGTPPCVVPAVGLIANAGALLTKSNIRPLVV